MLHYRIVFYSIGYASVAKLFVGIEYRNEMHRQLLCSEIKFLTFSFRSYELPYIASTVVAPLLKAEMERWNVLDEPRRFRDEFVAWRELLMMMPQTMANTAKRPEPGTQVTCQFHEQH